MGRVNISRAAWNQWVCSQLIKATAFPVDNSAVSPMIVRGLLVPTDEIFVIYLLLVFSSFPVSLTPICYSWDHLTKQLRVTKFFTRVVFGDPKLRQVNFDITFLSNSIINVPLPLCKKYFPLNWSCSFSFQIPEIFSCPVFSLQPLGEGVTFCSSGLFSDSNYEVNTKSS